MDKKLIVNFDITGGSNKDQIFDAFKYAHGGKIDLWFRLTEASEQPSGMHSSDVEKLGTPNAIADDYFTVKAVEYVNCDNWGKPFKIIRVKGSCDLFYLDTDDCTGFDNGHAGEAAYHVDFSMVYDVETHKGAMVCSNFRDCYFDPWQS